jgi:hypothetical protein
MMCSKSNALNVPKNYHQPLVNASFATTKLENHLKNFSSAPAAAQVVAPTSFLTSRPTQKFCCGASDSFRAAGGLSSARSHSVD